MSGVYLVLQNVYFLVIFQLWSVKFSFKVFKTRDFKRDLYRGGGGYEKNSYFVGLTWVEINKIRDSFKVMTFFWSSYEFWDKIDKFRDSFQVTTFFWSFKRQFQSDDFFGLHLDFGTI